MFVKKLSVNFLVRAEFLTARPPVRPDRWPASQTLAQQATVGLHLTVPGMRVLKLNYSLMAEGLKQINIGPFI